MAKLPPITDISDLDKLYEVLDEAHGPEHQQAVREGARELAETYAPKHIDLVDLAARLHDIGLTKGRDIHESAGAEMVAGDPRFDVLSKRNRRLLINAIRQHRASTGKPRSVIGKIISDADRVAGDDTIGALQRAVAYGRRHYPDLTEEEQYRRALEILNKKFAPGKHGRRHYFPETGKKLSDIFDPIVKMYKKDDLKAVRDALAQQEKAAEFAPGLPDPKRFGRVAQLPKGTPIPWVIQRHLAERAGPHYDVRFGPDKMYSWAARKLPEEPGQKTLAFRQPLHTGQYADFEGEIVSGYGKGTVKTHDKGRVIVTKAEPDKISFVVVHKKHPEMFTMVRKSGPPKPTTARQGRTQGGTWLMINTTPTDVIEHKKVRYAKVAAKDVEKLFDPKYLHQAKIDGAAALYRLLADRIEVLSYRPTTTGRPIVHTYRVGGTTNVSIPKRLVGSVLRGELYGVRTSTGRAVPPQELGGILNASTQKSLQKQRTQKVDLRNAVFNILRHGKKPVSIETPYPERLKMLQDIMQYLPKKKFHLPEIAGTPEEQRALWARVTGGEHPLTHEGVVAWPKAGGRPTKVKIYNEHDVYVRDIFPGKKRLAGTGAGGFGYSLEPSGDRAGEVGTGLSEELRKQMHENPEEFIGRVARIRAQGQFPSGAFRAPSLIGMHEDYPAVKAAQAITPEEQERVAISAQNLLAPTTWGGYAGDMATQAMVIPTLGTAWGGLRLLGRKLQSPLTKIPIGPGGKGIGAALKARWNLANMAKWPALMYSPVGAGLTVGFEGLTGLSEALADPDYIAGNIGFGEAAGRKLKSMGQASALKAHQAWKSPLKGLVMTPLHGAINPLASYMGLWQAIKRPFTSKSSSPLGQAIEKIGKDIGIEAHTLGDLVKAAEEMTQAPAPQPLQIGLADRLRAWMIGMKPEQLVRLRRGLSSMGDVFQTLQQMGVVKAK